MSSNIRGGTTVGRRHYNLFYFVKEALLGMFRNSVMSVASVLVLTSCLIVLGGFALIVYNININLDNLGLLNVIDVFLDYDATPEDAARIQGEIEGLDNVASVEYVSKEDGLKALSQEADASTIYTDILENPEDNPLADCFYITYADNARVSTLDYNLRHIDGVRKVNNRLDLAVSIENTKSVVSLVFSWFLLILVLVSVFIIVNTIKLAVFARRDEIFIMRYVGAGRWFITLPFLIEGVIIGALSGILAYFAEVYAYSYIVATVNSQIQFITISEIWTVSPILLGAFLAVGVVTGVVGSCISLGKYLNA